MNGLSCQIPAVYGLVFVRMFLVFLFFVRGSWQKVWVSPRVSDRPDLRTHGVMNEWFATYAH